LKAVILGASSGIGQAISRVMALRGDELYLLGRNSSKLELCAKDLAARSGKPIQGYSLCDLECPEGFADALDAADSALEGMNAVIVTAGIFDTQDRLETDPKKTNLLLTINFTNTILFCEEARKRLLQKGGGTLCIVSSVAGDRGRKPVILYGAAKAGLSYYLEGLDHKYRRRGLKTLCVKPGFIHTPMTANLKPPPFAGSSNLAAYDIVRAMERGKAVAYTPFPWKWIMLAIRLLPRTIMRRINF
jgi:decaprenylphospho-beta-D-erythro-pentofuranosid-2-ulose 2-reductase